MWAEILKYLVHILEETMTSWINSEIYWPLGIATFYYFYPEWSGSIRKSYCNGVLESVGTIWQFDLKYLTLTLGVSLKLSFFEKATNICAIFLMVWRLLSNCQNHEDEFLNLCGLLRKVELLKSKIQHFCRFKWNVKTDFSLDLIDQWTPDQNEFETCEKGKSSSSHLVNLNQDRTFW